MRQGTKNNALQKEKDSNMKTNKTTVTEASRPQYEEASHAERPLPSWAL